MENVTGAIAITAIKIPQRFPAIPFMEKSPSHNRKIPRRTL
jgi:hypothetical protein